MSHTVPICFAFAAIVLVSSLVAVSDDDARIFHMNGTVVTDPGFACDHVLVYAPQCGEGRALHAHSFHHSTMTQADSTSSSTSAAESTTRSRVVHASLLSSGRYSVVTSGAYVFLHMPDGEAVGYVSLPVDFHLCAEVDAVQISPRVSSPPPTRGGVVLWVCDHDHVGFGRAFFLTSVFVLLIASPLVACVYLFRLRGGTSLV